MPHTCRGDYSAALAAIVDALPGKSRQAVITHSRWHADLTELDMRRCGSAGEWPASASVWSAAVLILPSTEQACRGIAVPAVAGIQ